MKTPPVDALIRWLESQRLGWSLDHAGWNLIEARIWRWPYVIGRYRPTEPFRGHAIGQPVFSEPLAAMLAKACQDAGLEIPPELAADIPPQPAPPPYA
jgi:hypothetical protein